MEMVRRAGREAVGCGEVRVRRGWVGGVVQFLGNREGDDGGVQIHILSVAWSPDWIWGVLEAGARAVGYEDGVGVRVVCNDVLRSGERDGEGNGDGDKEWEQGLYVAADKLRMMRTLAASASTLGARDEGEREMERPWIIYIGDSITDLECLLEADVGIVIRDEGALGSEQRELKEVLGRAGIGTYWIGEFGEVQTGEERVLWWARDFEEVVGSGCLVLEGKIFGRGV